MNLEEYLAELHQLAERDRLRKQVPKATKDAKNEKLRD